MRRLHQRASATLLWSILAFIALHVGFLVATEYSLIELRPLPRVTANPDDRPLTIVVLGSSRTQFGLQGRHLSKELTNSQGRPVKVLNYGISAAGPLTQLICLKHLLSGGIKPDLILVETVPTMLTDRGAAPLESILLPLDLLYRKELAELPAYGFATDDVQKQQQRIWLSPWYAYRFMLLNRLASSWVPMGKEAWWPMPGNLHWRPWAKKLDTPERREKALQQAYREHANDLRTFRLSPVASGILREIMSTCRQEQIPTALLLMPEGNVFRSWYPESTNRQVYALMDELSQEFNAPLIDAREWVPDEGFADAHHMIPSGAAIFSERLRQEILTPLLAGKPTRSPQRKQG